MPPKNSHTCLWGRRKWKTDFSISTKKQKRRDTEIPAMIPKEYTPPPLTFPPPHLPTPLINIPCASKDDWVQLLAHPWVSAEKGFMDEKQKILWDFPLRRKWPFLKVNLSINRKYQIGDSGAKNSGMVSGKHSQNAFRDMKTFRNVCYPFNYHSKIDFSY